MAKRLALTDTEATKLLAMIKTGNGTEHQQALRIRNYLIAMLMIEAGLRRSEVCALRIYDVWWSGKVRECVDLSRTQTKRSVPRSVPISPDLASAIQDHISRNHPSPGPDSTDYLVYTRDPKSRINGKLIERIIVAAGREGLGRPITPHTLRHTFADRMRRVTDIRTVQELLGHKHLSSTMIYTHPDHTDKVRAIAAAAAARKETLTP